MTDLHSFVLAALLHFAPPEHQDKRPWADPSRDYALARYSKVADAIVSACESRKNPKACASLLTAIAVGESAVSRDTDEGPCHRSGPWKRRCDGGRAVSVYQIHPTGADADGPITAERLFADRKLAARIAYRAAAGSLQMCRHLPDPVDHLSGLSGRCQAGLKSARERYKLWRKIAQFQIQEKK